MTTTTVFASLLAPVLADAGEWDHMGGWRWGMAATGWVLMLSLIALVGWAIWTGTTGRNRPTEGHDHTAQAPSILSERYARGDIDRDEYLERRVHLEADRG